MNLNVMRTPADRQAGFDVKQVETGRPQFDDFIGRLDEKLHKRNELLLEKMLAWGKLLDEAGWSVALEWGNGVFGLSNNANRDFQRIAKTPSAWEAVLAAMDRIAPESLYQKGD